MDKGDREETDPFEHNYSNKKQNYESSLEEWNSLILEWTPKCIFSKLPQSKTLQNMFLFSQLKKAKGIFFPLEVIISIG